MSRFGSFGFVALMAALLMSSQAQAQSRLQQIADEAALAGVQVLGASGQPSDAVEAAKQTVAALPGVSAEINASPADLIVTVKLSTADAKAKPASVASTARYLPPDQPAAWGWAQRQRFAVKPSAFVVGANCLRDCGANPLR